MSFRFLRPYPPPPAPPLTPRSFLYTQYITSYQVKGELDTHNSFAILCKASKAREDASGRRGNIGGGIPVQVKPANQVLRGAIQLQGHVDMPAPFAAAALMGQSLEYMTGRPVRCELKWLNKMCMEGSSRIQQRTKQRRQRARRLVRQLIETKWGFPTLSHHILSFCVSADALVTLGNEVINEDGAKESGTTTASPQPSITATPSGGGGYDTDDDDEHDITDGVVSTNGVGDLCRTSQLEDYFLRNLDETGNMNLADYVRLTKKVSSPTTTRVAVSYKVVKEQYVKYQHDLEEEEKEEVKKTKKAAASGDNSVHPPPRKVSKVKVVPRSTVDLLAAMGLDADDLKGWRAKSRDELKRMSEGSPGNSDHGPYAFTIIWKEMLDLADKFGSFRAPHPQRDSFTVTRKSGIYNDIAVFGYVPKRPPRLSAAAACPKRRFFCQYPDLARKTAKEAAAAQARAPAKAASDGDDPLESKSGSDEAETKSEAGEATAGTGGGVDVITHDEARQKAYEAPGVKERMLAQIEGEKVRVALAHEDAARFTLMLLRPFHLDVRTGDNAAPRLLVEALRTMPVEGATKVSDWMLIPAATTTKASKGTPGNTSKPKTWVRIDAIVENALSQVETRIASFLSPRDSAIARDTLRCTCRHPFRRLRERGHQLVKKFWLAPVAKGGVRSKGEEEEKNNNETGGGKKTRRVAPRWGSRVNDVGRRYPTFRAALRAWTFRDRRSSDTRWYLVAGVPVHPLLESLWTGSEGKDRATRLAKERKEQDEARREEAGLQLSSDVRAYLDDFGEKDPAMEAIDPSVSSHINYEPIYRNDKEAKIRGHLVYWTKMFESNPTAATKVGVRDARVKAGSTAASGGTSERTRGNKPNVHDIRALQGMARPRSSDSHDELGGDAHDELGGLASLQDTMKRYQLVAKEILFGGTPGVPAASDPSIERRAALPRFLGQTLRESQRFWALPAHGEILSPADPLTHHVMAPSTTPDFASIIQNGGLLPWARRVGPSPIEWSLLRGLDPEQSFILYKRSCRFEIQRGVVPAWISRLKSEELKESHTQALREGMLIFGKPGAGKSHAHNAFTAYLARLGCASMHQSAAFCGAAASRINGNTLASLFALAFSKSDGPQKKKKPSGVVGGAAEPEGRSDRDKTTSQQGAPDPDKQAFFNRLMEITLDEYWAIGLPLMTQCNEAARRYRSTTKNEFMGGLLVTAMGDPYQKQWKGTELYGDPIGDSARIATVTAGGGGRAHLTGAIGRTLVRDAFTNVHFLDGQHRAKDSLQRHVNIRCRHGSADAALHRTIHHRNMLCRATPAEQTRFKAASVVATQHGLLESVARAHPIDYCRRHGILAVVWDQPDTIVKLSGKECKPTDVTTEAFNFLKDLIIDHPAVLPANNTGKIHGKFCYIPAYAAPTGVAPYEYSLTTTGGGSTGSLGSTGAVTHAAVTLVGLDMDTRDELDPAKDIDENNCWHLKHMPLCLYAKLVNSQMAGFTVRDDLPSGVIPIVPQTKSWTLDLNTVSHKFWNTHGPHAPDLHAIYGMKRTGFMLRPGSSSPPRWWSRRGVCGVVSDRICPYTCAVSLTRRCSFCLVLTLCPFLPGYGTLLSPSFAASAATDWAVQGATRLLLLLHLYGADRAGIQVRMPAVVCSR